MIRRILSKQLTVCVYITISLLVCLPLLKNGYVLTTDMPWGPRAITVPTANNTWLLHEVIRILAYVIGSAAVQKIILVLIFLLGGLGAHRLFVRAQTKKYYGAAPYVAGILYIFNPFVYSRFMQGQWIVLLGYALLPWTITSLWAFITQPKFSTAWKAVVWTALIGLTSLHAVGFVVLAALVLCVAAGRRQLNLRIIWGGAIVTLWSLINSLWLYPALVGHSYISSEVGSFGPTQLHAFATGGSIAGNVPLSALLLEGFWPDLQLRYILPSSLITWWPAIVLLSGLIIIGTLQVIRRRDRFGIALIVLGAIALWLGMGITWRYSASTTYWLIDHIPFYRGYREPQKWLMLLALSYSYLTAVGIAWLASRLPKVNRPEQQDWRPLLTGVAAALPIILVPVLLWGANGQLRSSRYPADWYTVRQVLDDSNTNGSVLVLPWHQYIRLKFTNHEGGRVVANPARHIFNQQMITGNNTELRGVPPVNTSSVETLMNNTVLQNTKTLSGFGEILTNQPQAVSYIILMKESDFKDYSWLDRQTGVKKVFDGPTIRLYKITAKANGGY